MFLSPSTLRATRRHVFRVVAVGLTLSLAPLVPTSGASLAEAPAVAVTGLARGARGPAVVQLQEALLNQGVGVAGGADGIFGPATESALRSFQRAQGLTASGAVDDATALALGLASSPHLGLSQGTRGDEVRTLQERLLRAGFESVGRADGIFGAKTAGALREFQSSRGLSPSGTVDVATAAALGTVTASQPGGGAQPEARADDGGDEATGYDQSSSPLVGLEIGDRGERVAALQRALIDRGIEVIGGADGIFGVLTAKALTTFQTGHGLSATGTVNATTAAALAASDGDRPKEQSNDDDDDATSPLLGLRYGARGSAVKELQRSLIDAGVAVRGGADGIFGPATKAALQRFQRDRDLEVSGTVDDATLAALSASPSGIRAVAANPLMSLAVGSLGSSVQQLQQAIIDAGVTVRGGADGIFGPATHNALQEFQRSQGLDATGVVDAATIEALDDPAPVRTTNDDDPGGYAEYGEKGPRVVALQSAIVEAGIALRGGVDGDYGGGTSAAVMDLQRREGLRVTGRVDEATAAALGLSRAPTPEAPDADSVTLEVFPVQGKCYYGDSWHSPRGGGRVHLGVDIIAPTGKLLYAVADGEITKVYRDYPGALAGNGVRLTMDDGTYFFYAHMDSVADGIDVGVEVRAGQVLGYVGDTGSSGTPHLHLEVHPQGGSAVNPYPLVKAIDACDVTTPLAQR